MLDKIKSLIIEEMTSENHAMFEDEKDIVADAIAKGLGRETAAAGDAARDMNMYLDDFECCKAACGEAC